MKKGFSDQIRRVAKEKYVDPAVKSGRTEFAIPVRGMLDSLVSANFPRNHTPQICSSIQTTKFLVPNGLEIVGVDGPPSGQSTTLVVHYRITGKATDGMGKQGTNVANDVAAEDAGARAKRLVSGLKGLLKEELSEYGGAESFVQWIRSDEEAA